MFAPFLIALSLIGGAATDQGLIGKVPEALLIEAPAKTPMLEQEAVTTTLPGISVELECVAYVDGRIDNCVVVGETRPGLGFGAAAVALMNGATLGPDEPKVRSAPVKFLHTIEFTPD